MEDSIDSGNWRITRSGSLILSLFFVAFLSYLAYFIPLIAPVLTSVVGGLVLGLSTLFKYKKELEYLFKPFSEFLGMFAGFLLILSFVVFFSLSFDTVLEAVEQSSIEGVLELIGFIVLPVFGYSLVILGMFLSASSSLLISSERVKKSLSIGLESRDYFFPAILGFLTVLSVVGTSFVRDLPLSDIYSWILVVLVRNSIFSGLKSVVLLLTAYFLARKSLALLPTRELLNLSDKSFYRRLNISKNTINKSVYGICLAVIFESFVNLSILDYFSILNTPGFRKSLLAIILISSILIVFVKCLKLLTFERDSLKTYLPFLVFSLLAYGIALAFSLLLGYFAEFLPEILGRLIETFDNIIGIVPTVIGLMTVSSIFILLFQSSINILKKAKILTEDLENITLLSGGIFLSGLGFYLYNPNQTVLFAGVAVSIVVWSLGKRFTILGREIGRKGYTKQSEIFYTLYLGSVGVAGIIISEIVLIYSSHLSLVLLPETSRPIIFLLSIASLGLLAIFLNKS